MVLEVQEALLEVQEVVQEVLEVLEVLEELGLLEVLEVVLVEVAPQKSFASTSPALWREPPLRW